MWTTTASSAGNSIWTIYIDGVKKGQWEGQDPINTKQVLYAAGPIPNTCHTNIGSYSSEVAAGVGEIDGTFKDIRIYNRDLNLTEITNLYNSGVPFTGKLVVDEYVGRNPNLSYTHADSMALNVFDASENLKIEINVITPYNKSSDNSFIGPSGNSIYMWFNGGSDGEVIDICGQFDLCRNYFKIITGRFNYSKNPVHHWVFNEIGTAGQQSAFDNTGNPGYIDNGVVPFMDIGTSNYGIDGSIPHDLILYAGSGLTYGNGDYVDLQTARTRRTII